VSLILDLSVVVLMLTVLSCLALLTWTLAVSSVRASADAEARVRQVRASVAVARDRIRTTPPGDRSDR